MEAADEYVYLIRVSKYRDVVDLDELVWFEIRVDLVVFTRNDVQIFKAFQHAVEVDRTRELPRTGRYKDSRVKGSVAKAGAGI